jgi:hypothetical protein
MPNLPKAVKNETSRCGMSIQQKRRIRQVLSEQKRIAMGQDRVLGAMEKQHRLLNLRELGTRGQRREETWNAQQNKHVFEETLTSSTWLNFRMDPF